MTMQSISTLSTRTLSRGCARHGVLLAIILICLVTPSVQATLRVWSGGGADNFWNTAANWTNNSAPVAGDDLLFPAGSSRLSNSNNFAATTTFNSITFAGSNYVINGNAITKRAAMNNNPPVGTNTFN